MLDLYAKLDENVPFGAKFSQWRKLDFNFPIYNQRYFL